MHHCMCRDVQGLEEDLAATTRLSAGILLLGAHVFQLRWLDYAGGALEGLGAGVGVNVSR